MTKYGNIAIRAAIAARNTSDLTKVWVDAALYFYPHSSAAVKKCCPKNAFLGLAEEGKIIGIAKGKYTSSLANKDYALNALTLLSNYPELANDKKQLWMKSCDSNTKNHNNQMDVVLALWQGGYLNNAT